MTLVNTETGEIVEPLERAEAERLTTRIRLRLDTIADNYVAVMPLIREAIERQAWSVLGYCGVSEYVSECFGDALSQLSTGVRREVVSELAAANMSTRAIARVVGVSQKTADRDVRAARESHDSPAEPTFVSATEAVAGIPDPKVDPAGALDAVIARGFPAPPATSENAAVDVECDRPAPIVGLDGKSYQRPAAKPRRRPLTDAARDAGWDLRKSADRVVRLADDDRFDSNKDEVAAHLRGHLTHAIEVLQDVLARINN